MKFNEEQAQAALMEYLDELNVQVVMARNMVEQGPLMKMTPEEEVERQEMIDALVLEEKPVIIGNFYIKRIISR